MLPVADSVDFPSFVADGEPRPFVKTPAGWGLRQDAKRFDLPLIALQPAAFPQLDTELQRLIAEQQARTRPPAPPADPGAGDEDDDYPLSDEDSLMWWKMLGAAAPALVPIAEALVDQVTLAIESGVTDHRVMNAGLMRAFRGLTPADQAEVRKRLADPETVSLVTGQLPRLMPKELAAKSKDPAIERAVEELIGMFRAATRT